MIKSRCADMRQKERKTRCCGVAESGFSDTRLSLLEDVALLLPTGSKELTTGGSCTIRLYMSASGVQAAVTHHSLMFSHHGSAERDYLWQVGAVGRLEDEKGYVFH